MKVYSLSPSAYEGLLELASDSLWCRDYQRILRFLDAAVSLEEAAVLGTDCNDTSADHKTWKQVAFLGSTEQVSIRRG